MMKETPAKPANPALIVCKSCKEIAIPSIGYPGLCITCGQEQYSKDIRKPFEAIKPGLAEIVVLEFNEVPASGKKGTMIDVDPDDNEVYAANIRVLILKIGDRYMEVGYGGAFNFYLADRGTTPPVKKDGAWIWDNE
jgi:hypothetical protein